MNTAEGVLGPIPTEVKATVKALEPDAEVILYGSRARGDHREDSDWDFLVLVDEPVTVARTDRIRHALYEIEWSRGEVISCIVRSRKQWRSDEYRALPFHWAVDHEGVTV